jgi:hypothetical protein
MVIEFRPEKDIPIVLKASGSAVEKIAFVRNLCDKAHDKINHFDRLRQQLLNYAIVLFSALLAFIIKAENAQLQILGCLGIAGLMVIFRYLDHRYHRLTHGFEDSIRVFNQVIPHMLNDPKDDVSFLQYYRAREDTAEQRSLQTKIYFYLGLCVLILGVVIWVRTTFLAFLHRAYEFILGVVI